MSNCFILSFLFGVVVVLVFGFIVTLGFCIDIRLNGGQITCPECRAIIPKNGMKPVYLQFFDSNTEPDYIKLENNHQKIIQELRESVTKIKKITQELQCEKLKNVRMGRQLMMVNQKWLKAKNEIEVSYEFSIAFCQIK